MYYPVGSYSDAEVPPRRFDAVLDRIVRGGLTFGLVGMGLGGVFVPVFGVSFTSAWQWGFTAAGTIGGVVLVVVWRRRHHA